MNLILVSCKLICAAHLYDAGFEHPKLNSRCYCAYEIRKSDPTPMPLTLRWKREVPEEDRKATVSEPIGPTFPRYNLLSPEDE